MSFSESKVFKNEDALGTEWLPKNLTFRETQHHRIAACIRPLLQGRSGRNALICGTPGIGKTAAVKLVLRELEEHPDVNSPDIYIIYVNCWQKNTTYKIFVEICDQLGYKFTQNKNTEDLFKIIENVVNKKAAVFAFDEIDKVEDVDFLYNIFTDIFKKTILMITNHPQWYTTVDERIKSRLLPERIDFLPYNSEEIKGILSQRIEFAFGIGVVAQDALSVIHEKTIEMGDLRTGLYLLREAGMCAEEESVMKITKKHAESAISKIANFAVKPEDVLSNDAKRILELVKSQTSGKMGDMFKLYQSSGGGGTYKTFQRRVSELSDGGFIDAKKVVGGKEGSTTIISGKNKDLGDY